LVTCKNESGGVWIWIAKPWELLYDSNPHYYLPSGYFSKIRIIKKKVVGKKAIEETLERAKPWY
jgi:hypothetical protein